MTISHTTTAPEKGVAKSVWLALASGTATLTGTPENYSRYQSITVQVKGTFAGATLSILGSQDGSNYQILNDSRGEGNALSFTGADVRTCTDVPQYVRPEITAAASGTTSLDVYITARKRGA